MGSGVEDLPVSDRVTCGGWTVPWPVARGRATVDFPRSRGSVPPPRTAANAQMEGTEFPQLLRNLAAELETLVNAGIGKDLLEVSMGGQDVIGPSCSFDLCPLLRSKPLSGPRWRPLHFTPRHLGRASTPNILSTTFMDDVVTI